MDVFKWGIPCDEEDERKGRLLSVTTMILCWKVLLANVSTHV